MQDISTLHASLKAQPLLAEDPADWKAVAFTDSGRLRSDEAWRVRDDVYVVGLHYYRTAVDRFFYAAWDKALADPPIELARIAQGGRDAGGVGVFGLIPQSAPKRFRGDGGPERLLLGYLPREIAAELAESAPDAPLTAELRECAWIPGDAGSKVVKLSVLVPRRNRFPDISRPRP